MLLHQIIIHRYQPRLLLPLLQTIRRRVGNANGETRDGDEVVEWDADEEEQEGDLDDG